MADGSFSSGGAGGFGSDTTVQRPNSAADLIDALRLYLTLPTSTAGSELGQWLVQVVASGALADVFAVGFQNLTTPAIYIGPVNNNNSIRCSANNFQIARGGIVIDISTSGTTGIVLSSRIQENRANGSVSTNTLSVSIVANLTVVPGTPTINGIATSSIQAGYRCSLECASGTTIVHNSGTPGSGAVAILTPTAANITTSSTRIIPVRYNGTNWYVEG